MRPSPVSPAATEMTSCSDRMAGWISSAMGTICAGLAARNSTSQRSVLSRLLVAMAGPNVSCTSRRRPSSGLKTLPTAVRVSSASAVARSNSVTLASGSSSASENG